MTTSKIVGLALLSLFAGCATQESIIVKVPFEVKVPVEVPCKITWPVKPVWPMDQLPGDVGLDVFVVGSAALAEIELREEYEGELSAALKRCAESK